MAAFDAAAPAEAPPRPDVPQPFAPVPGRRRTGRHAPADEPADDVPASESAVKPKRASRHEGRPGAGEHAARNGAFIRELPFLLIIAVVLALMVKSLVLQAFFIPSKSMEATLLVGDRVLVNRLAYRVGEPAHGQVVVFFRADPEAGPTPTGAMGFVKRTFAQAVGNAPPGSEDLIKRVIGVPGDVLFARDGVLWRNGQKLDETYLRPGTKTSSFGPIRVPDGHIWVMGDNREDSFDSRRFGPIDQDALVGRAVVLIWPFNRVTSL
jgi:signal peptidase I